MPSSIPKLNHRTSCPEYSSRRTSVSSRVRRLAASPSRFPDHAVHLILISTIINRERPRCLLWTPSTNYTSQIHLLWVISNKGSKVIDNTTVVTIWTQSDNRYCHCWLQGSENCCDRLVIQLLEQTEGWIIVVFTLRYQS